MPFPPFELNITKYSFGFHCAYKFTVPFGVPVKFLTTCLSSYLVPVPSSCVFQLSNVYPVFVNEFGVMLCSTSYVNCWFVIFPVPVFSLNTTVYVFAVFSAVAVNVTSCFGIVIVVSDFPELYNVPKSTDV